MRTMAFIFAQTRNCDLGYSEDAVLQNENRSKLQIIIDFLDDVVGMFVIHFAVGKYEILLRDRN